MKSISLGLVLKDKDYAAVLADAVSLFYRNFIVHVEGGYASDSVLGLEDGALDRVFEYDILVLDEGYTVEFEKWKNTISCCIFLSETKEGYFEDTKKYYLYKYSDVHKIGKALLEAYRIYKGIEICENRLEKSNIISFVSTSGGAGTSSIAITVARCLSLFQGKNVLYLDLSFFGNELVERKIIEKALEEKRGEEKGEASRVGKSQEEQGGGIMRFIYDMKYKGDHSISPEKYLKRDPHKVYYFESVNGLNPLKNTDFDEICEIIKRLTQKLNLDLTIIDIGSDFSIRELEILDFSNRVYLVHKSKFSEKRKEQIMRAIRLYNGGTCEPYDIVNFCEESGYYEREDSKDFGESPRDATQNRLFFISEDADSFEDFLGFSQIDMDRSFGISVSEIASEIL